jgi:hypothetical protein
MQGALTILLLPLCTMKNVNPTVSEKAPSTQSLRALDCLSMFIGDVIGGLPETLNAEPVRIDGWRHAWFLIIRLICNRYQVLQKNACLTAHVQVNEGDGSVSTNANDNKERHQISGDAHTAPLAYNSNQREFLPPMDCKFSRLFS